MGFSNYRRADLESGRTVSMVLDMLPGKVKPEIKVEHLGDENRTYLSDEIAKANASASRASGNKKKLMSKARIAEMKQQRRDELKKHIVRELTATHDDGSPATNADIPAWVDSLPPDVVDLIYLFSLNAENFRTSDDEPEEDGADKKLAEK